LLDRLNKKIYKTKNINIPKIPVTTQIRHIDTKAPNTSKDKK